MSETPLTDALSEECSKSRDYTIKHYPIKWEDHARSLELQVTSLTAKLAEKEATSETWKETAEAIEESARNLAAFAKDDACFSLPMSGASITARDAIRSLRNDLRDAAKHLNAVYRQCDEVKRTSKERFEQIDALTSQLAAARRDSERVEKLRWYAVNVRKPLAFGSENIFWSSPNDEDEQDETPSDLREQIDALPPAPTK